MKVLEATILSQVQNQPRAGYQVHHLPNSDPSPYFLHYSYWLQMQLTENQYRYKYYNRYLIIIVYEKVI